MKKVLLATTILGMTAGFAAAEIAFTGEATAGFAQNGTKNGGKTSATVVAGKTSNDVINPYASFKLSIAASGESDSGVSFGASASVTSGTTYEFGYDKDGFKAQGGTIGAPTVFISGNFGKIAVKADGWKEYQADANEKYDVEYTHTIGGVSIGVRTDLQSDFAATKGKSSIKLGYKINAIALEAKFDEVGSKWGVSAAYTMGALTFTLATDDASVSSLKVAYKGANGISGDIKADSKNVVEANAAYTTGALTLGAGYTSGVTPNRWAVTGSYDLGGGLSVVGGVNHVEDMYLGAVMKF